MKKIFIVTLAILTFSAASAQNRGGYYSSGGYGEDHSRGMNREISEMRGRSEYGGFRNEDETSIEGFGGRNNAKKRNSHSNDITEAPKDDAKGYTRDGEFSNAQSGRYAKGGSEQRVINSAKTIEMLQKRLQLNLAQAQAFAPVYQKYALELRQVQKETRTYVNSLKEKEQTPKVAKKILQAQLNQDKKIIKIKGKYIKPFMNYLTQEQISKVFTFDKNTPRSQGNRVTQRGYIR